MPRTGVPARRHRRDIHRLVGETLVLFGDRQLRLTGSECLPHAGSGLPHELSGRGAIGRIESLEAAVQPGERG